MCGRAAMIGCGVVANVGVCTTAGLEAVRTTGVAMDSGGGGRIQRDIDMYTHTQRERDDQ